MGLFKQLFGRDEARSMDGYIKASDFYTLEECDRKVFLNYHGDPDLRVEPSDFDQWIMDEGKRFEQEVVALYRDVYTPAYRIGDWEAGYDATLELMSAGVPYIYQSVLIHDDMVGIPDLLERVDGGSRWGGFYYRPIDIKLATSARRQHRLQVMAYILMLEGAQNVRPDGSLFIRVKPDDAQPGTLYEDVKVVLDEDIYESKLAEIRKLAEGFEPLPFISSVCKSCPWQEVCENIAEESWDVSLMPGISRKIWNALHQRGLGTLPAAAAADKAQLINIHGIGQKTADKIVERSKALTSGNVIRTGNPDLPAPSGNDIFFDVESVPPRGWYYMIGMVVAQGVGRYAYEYFLAETPDQEFEMWEAFLRRLSRHRGILYHYGVYERTVIKKLAERHGFEDRAERIMARMVDLERVLKDSAVLPLRGYSLKDVAPWLGFQWDTNTDNAADSMLEYLWYQEDGRRQRLRNILAYNEADCYATVEVRDWLLTLPSI